ncbi:MAG: TonB-dependent receptor domain-containing protein [Bryobacteraceae bacterium]
MMRLLGASSTRHPLVSASVGLELRPPVTARNARGGALAALAFVAVCSAQVDTGRITGLISDSTGAVISGATVTIAGEETQLQYTVSSNETGLYVSPGLRTGRYRVTVEKDGFRTEIRTGVEVRVQDRVQLNLGLNVAATRSEVTVAAEAALLQSETSSLGQVIEQRQIVELPLNGRNFIGLAILGAGALPSSRTAERDNFVANGARPVQNTYLLDGVENKNHILGFDRSSAQVIQPNPDMIQEFIVQTSTFSAEFGQSAGGVVNVTMKSGTNDLHGSVFEFLRNEAFKATPFFQPPGGGKPRFRQNQFGAAIGGPIVKSKTYLFGAWQASRAQSTAPGFASVPTAAQREGAFGGRNMFDPATYVAATNSRQTFPNNTIPANRFDNVARQVIPLYPLPNLPGAANNFFSNQRQEVDGNQYAGRLDHQLTPSDTLFVRFVIQQDQNLFPGLMPPPANDPSIANPHARSAALSQTHSTPSGKVNEFRYGFTRSYLQQDIEGENLFAKFGIQGAPVTDFIRGLPQFASTGFSTIGTTGPGARPIAATGSGNLPVLKTSNVHHITDNLAWVRGRHSIKLGGDVQFVQMNGNATNAARPNFSFDGRFTNNPGSPANTGSALGDFFLGLPQSVAVSTRTIAGIRQRIFQGYLQDDWKVNRRLTLNLGVRYELPKPFYEVNNLQANFIFESDNPAYLTLLDAQDAARGNLGNSLVHTDFNNFAPRVGLAYTLTPRTVIRAASGIFYGRDENIGVGRRLVNNPPYFVRTTLTTSTTVPNVKLDVGLPPGVVDPSAVRNPELNSHPLEYSTPYVIQWNFNIERQLDRTTVFQVGYTGSGTRKLYFPLDWNRPLPGAGAIDPRRPFRGYTGIFLYAPIVRSSYNALLARLERKFSNGLSFLAAYTWGHSLDNSRSNNDNGDPGPTNSRDINAEHASSNFDIKHRVVFSYVWELPFGANKRRATGGPGAAVLGGWSVSGITSIQGGLPFTVQLNRDPTNSTSPGRPDRLRDGGLARGQRTLQRFFDITAFVDPAVTTPGVFRFGDSGRAILRGPGQVNFDFALLREFRFTERWNLQFRGECFNLFNTPQFSLPASTIGNPQVGIINSVATPERQIQLALKLRF